MIGGTKRSALGLYGATLAYWATLAVATLWTPVSLYSRLMQKMHGRVALQVQRK